MKLAIIPARGGSKRIPGKNIRPFAGKPLIAYSIEAAKKSNIFDKIIVSTDCEVIRDVALEFGAEVPFVRPAELSNDFVGTNAVTQHGIKFCTETYTKPEYTCCIYATAPFIQPSFILEGLHKLQANPLKSFAFSVTSFPFPIQRAIRITDDGIEPNEAESMGKRSQDLEEMYHDAGQFYWGTTEGYFEQRSMFSSASIPIVLPRHLVQDIDTSEDWTRAELMYQAYVRDNK